MTEDVGSALSPSELRAAFATIPAGVTAVAGLVDGAPGGIAASSFTSVSLEPPLVSVCVARTSTSWPALRTIPRIGLSVLAEDHGLVARALSARQPDRFADVSWMASPQGAVFVHGSVLWMECLISQEIPAGDHLIVVFEIRSLSAYPDVAPLIFHGSTFRSLKEL